MSKNQTLFCLLVFAVGHEISAAPIHSDVALTPSTGTTVVRTQARYANADKSGAERETLHASLVVVHGFTGRFSVIAKIPYEEFREKSMSGSGLTDPALIGKLRFWQNDSTALTDRATLLLGIETPWGESGFSSRSWDPLAGLTFTHQGLRSNGRLLELDATLTQKINTHKDGMNQGDVTRYDLALGYQLWPGVTANRLLMGLLELNGSYKGKDEKHGMDLANTGGSMLYLSPGVQWVTRPLILEAGFQIPIVRNLHGDQQQNNYTVTAGIRTQF